MVPYLRPPREQRKSPTGPTTGRTKPCATPPRDGPSRIGSTRRACERCIPGSSTHPGPCGRSGSGDVMDETFFPIIWREDGYRSSFLEPYLRREVGWARARALPRVGARDGPSDGRSRPPSSTDAGVLVSRHRDGEESSGVDPPGDLERSRRGERRQPGRRGHTLAQARTTESGEAATALRAENDYVGSPVLSSLGDPVGDGEAVGQEVDTVGIDGSAHAVERRPCPLRPWPRAPSRRRRPGHRRAARSRGTTRTVALCSRARAAAKLTAASPDSVLSVATRIRLNIAITSLWCLAPLSFSTTPVWNLCFHHVNSSAHSWEPLFPVNKPLISAARLRAGLSRRSVPPKPTPRPPSARLAARQNQRVVGSRHAPGCPSATARSSRSCSSRIAAAVSSRLRIPQIVGAYPELLLVIAGRRAWPRRGSSPALGGRPSGD